MAQMEIKVPDIGDFAEVTVIELMVKPGDTIAPEQSLITVESDKASMEIPASHGGVVKELKVKLGDKVAEGSVILTVEAAADAPAAAPAASAPAPAAPAAAARRSRHGAQGRVRSPAAAAPAFAGTVDLECDLLVLGAGPGGYSAAFRAADLGLKVVLVERYAALGGVCLNVGCIPSKALLHVAAVMDEVRHFADLGVNYPEPLVDVDKLRAHKGKVVGKLTGGLAAMAKMRKVTTVRGYGAFVGPNHVQVEETTGDGQEKTGKTQTIGFRNCIIAAGSQAVRLPFMPDDPRVVDSTGALALKQVPKRMLILGGGIIGLEMGTVYSTLGARLDVVEMLDGLMQGADRDLVKVWQKMNAPAFRQHHAQYQDGVGQGDRGRHRGARSLRRRRVARRPSRRPTTWCCRRSAARPTARRSVPTRPAWRSPTAASSVSTSRCAPTCRISSPSATSSASRCWRTRRCTRPMSRPR